MMRHALDALLSRVDSCPGETRVFGWSTEGHPLRVRCEVLPRVPADGATTPSGIMVYVEVPEAPSGRAEFAVCRWADSSHTVGYNRTPDEHRLKWTSLELLPRGLRLRVHWPHEEEPRQYDFAWTGERDGPVAQRTSHVRSLRGKPLRRRFLRRRRPWRSQDGEKRP